MLKSFKYALCGIKSAFCNERNLRIIAIIFVFTVAIGFVINLSLIEWAIVIICSAMVFGTEMINTSIESSIDLCTKQHNALAKKAKDIAAGATLILCMFSALVGLIIYIPHIIKLFEEVS